MSTKLESVGIGGSCYCLFQDGVTETLPTQKDAGIKRRVPVPTLFLLQAQRSKEHMSHSWEWLVALTDVLFP